MKEAGNVNAKTKSRGREKDDIIFFELYINIQQVFCKEKKLCFQGKIFKQSKGFVSFFQLDLET